MDTCKQPLDLGQGDQKLIRWHADPNDSLCNRKCHSFKYRGFQGNQNNFLTKIECEAACKGKLIFF